MEEQTNAHTRLQSCCPAGKCYWSQKTPFPLEGTQQDPASSTGHAGRCPHEVPGTATASGHPLGDVPGPTAPCPSRSGISNPCQKSPHDGTSGARRSFPPPAPCCAPSGSGELRDARAQDGESFEAPSRAGSSAFHPDVKEQSQMNKLPGHTSDRQDSLSCPRVAVDVTGTAKHTHGRHTGALPADQASASSHGNGDKDKVSFCGMLWDCLMRITKPCWGSSRSPLLTQTHEGKGLLLGTWGREPSPVPTACGVLASSELFRACTAMLSRG